MGNKIMNKFTTVPKSRKYNPLDVYANEKVAILEKTVQKIKTKHKK
jgi:hypothetical protein